MKDEFAVSSKVALGNCQGREGRYPVSEISASLSGGKVQLRCVTARCHRGIRIAEITPEAMDELAEWWLLARRPVDEKLPELKRLAKAGRDPDKALEAIFGEIRNLCKAGQKVKP